MNDEIVKYKKNVKIVHSSKESYIEKTKTQSLKEIFSYLDTRDFKSHPTIEVENDKIIKYKYIKEDYAPLEEKEEEFFKTIATLHYKTSRQKTINKLKYKNIYTKIINNIDYLKKDYEDLINKAEEQVYMPPSLYLLARNYKIINECLMYCEKNINTWYRSVENETKQRTCLLHNNLSMSHFIINKQENSNENKYLISWDKCLLDTPVLDLYKLYNKEIHNIDFIDGLKTYSKIVTLSNQEITLFNTLISIPPKLSLRHDEYTNTLEVKQAIKRIIKTHKLITANVFQIEED